MYRYVYICIYMFVYIPQQLKDVGTLPSADLRCSQGLRPQCSSNLRPQSSSKVFRPQY